MKCQCQIGEVVFQTSVGVRQGACTSSQLFTAFIDPTIDAVHSFGPDSWLGDMHLLLLMDDTVVFASSREAMTSKLNLLKNCTENIGMRINAGKSKFICVNGDTHPFTIDDMYIEHTRSYVYLGTPISSETIAKQVKQHLQQKMPHMFKFISFLNKHQDLPFCIKQQVWNSAIKSAIFYSCETWLMTDYKQAETIYMTTLKSMLGCRNTTCNEIVIAELQISNAKGYIQQKQWQFISKLQRRHDYNDSYIEKIMKLAMQVKSPAGKLVEKMMALQSDPRTLMNNIINEKILTATSSKRLAYKSINPDLKVHPMYSDPMICEAHRIATTRLRVGSHRLKIETGRWLRIPQEERLCPCGAIQTEEHVLCNCPLSEQIRAKFCTKLDYSSAENLMSNDCFELYKYCFNIINFFQ